MQKHLNMKSNSTLYAILLLFLFSCNDDDEVRYQSEGVITDYITADCGGYMIEIDETTYRFLDEDLPEDTFFNIADVIFPVPVRVSWSLKDNDCSQNRIKIHKLELIAVTQW